jgi:hypothetical protein
MNLHPQVVESFAAFCDAFGIPLFAHQREDFGEALQREDGRFRYRLCGVSWPRGDGKSWGGAATGIWRLITGRPPQQIISTALDLEGADVVLAHARKIVRGHAELRQAIEIRANSLSVPATGSRWTITSREHTASRGLHPDLVLYDEAAFARDDELFAALLAGQASVRDPLMLVTSTVGRRKSGPLWTIKTLAEGGDAAVCWRWCSENRSPAVTKAFLDRQRRILLPVQYAREHQNQWVDGADAFTTSADVEAAMARDWHEQMRGRADVRYVFFVDFGAVHDPTVIAVGHDEQGTAYVDKLVTLQGNREQPVLISAVEEQVRLLAQAFPPRRILIETWQGMATAQALQRTGLPVELFAPTAKTNAEQWPLLRSRLAARSVVLYPHAQLREELLNLVTEMTATGTRVIDRGKVHQDHAVAVRGVVAALTNQRACTSPVCTDPDCSGQPPLMLLPSDSWSAWRAAHPSPATLSNAEVVLATEEAFTTDTSAAPNVLAVGKAAVASVKSGIAKLLGRAVSDPTRDSHSSRDLALLRKIERLQARESKEQQTRVDKQRRARSAQEIERAIARQGHWWPGE